LDNFWIDWHKSIIFNNL